MFGRAVAHQPVAVAAEVRDPDVVAPDHEDVRLVGHQAVAPSVEGGSRTTQRKPRCAIEVSIICGCRAAGPVAEAVVRRAEVRAALDHAPRDVLAGLARVVALVGRGHARVGRDAARARDLVGVARHVPVGRPLPDVPGHVVEAVAVRREAPDRRGPLVAVELQVLPRELALPACSPSPSRRGSARRPRRTRRPRARRARRTPTRPRSAAPCPPRPRRPRRPRRRRATTGWCVAAVDRRPLAAGPLPERARDVRPPVAVVVEVDRPGRLAEDERARDEQLGIGVGVVRRGRAAAPRP